MCCVLWDLCVCLLCQNRIYISVNKRFLEGVVNLCTKCRTKFDLPCLWGSGNLWSPGCWWRFLESWSGVAHHVLGSQPCALVLFNTTWRRLHASPMEWSLWNMPGALGRACRHPSCELWHWLQLSACWESSATHRGLLPLFLQSGSCEHWSQSQ